MFLSFLSLPLLAVSTLADVSVTLPSSPTTAAAVLPNFLGLSVELSFVNEYFGNDTNSVPAAFISYMSSIRSRTLQDPILFRIGGNSMDSSTYVPDQSSPMIQFTNPQANSNDQPVTYGPLLWDVMNEVSKRVNGAQYLIGLSLRNPDDPNVPVLAGAAKSALGDNLDAYLLGNEPDLYTNHMNRPNLKNYTTDNYISEFSTSSKHLENTTAGNVIDHPSLGGPTTCCFWNLDALLQGGYLSNFTSILKYISLQHYPQNNCFGSYQYDLRYYLNHANVVSLAAWEQSGISLVTSNKAANTPKMLMSEFSSASCGGVPGISDTFGATLWTIDYGLQMASVGYSKAYLHTRERGISYNIVVPPDSGSTSWTTNPTYYALLVLPEALQAPNGSFVTDLNVANSTHKEANATVGGYAIYSAQDSSVRQFVLFNYDNTTSNTFTLPANAFTSSSKNQVQVKYLSAPNVTEKTNIAWGGQTLAGVDDGKLVATNEAWARPNQNVDCSNGCAVTVPGPGLAVVFASQPPTISPNDSSRAVRNGWLAFTVVVILMVHLQT